MEADAEKLAESVKSEMIRQLSKVIIGGIAALLALAVSGWWLYLKPKVDDYIASQATAVPSGAVVAFLSSEQQTCPSGPWELYKPASGRFILGAGDNTDSDLTSRSLGDVGGAELVTLMEENLPPHGHKISTDSISGNGIHDGLAGYPHNGATDLGILTEFSNIPDKDGFTTVHPDVLEKTGGGVGHENMPPYVALYYCIRTESETQG